MRNILDLSAKLRTNLPAQDLVLNRWSTTTEKQISSAVFAETLRGGRMFKVAECDEEIVTAGGTALTLAELKPRPAALQELSDYCAMIAGVLDQHGSEDRPSLIKRLFGSKRS
jgi:hypothetical protein